MRASEIRGKESVHSSSFEQNEGHLRDFARCYPLSPSQQSAPLPRRGLSTCPPSSTPPETPESISPW